MVYYVIKLDEGVYVAESGPYGERNIVSSPGAAKRFLKKKWAREHIHFRWSGFKNQNIERIEVPDGR